MTAMARAETRAASAASPSPSAAPAGLLQRACACGRAAGVSGECGECRKKKWLGVQTKLKVNEPGDVYEQEADRIADQLVAAPVHAAGNRASRRIQRLSSQPATQMGGTSAPASVDAALASPGRPLEAALRQEMEQRFGHDFSKVRVHSGGAAEQSAEDVNAAAYTIGHDMVFGAGRFQPATEAGRRLLAHELTHVVQQSGVDRSGVAGSGDEGCRLSHGPLARQPLIVSRSVDRVLQRSPTDSPPRRQVKSKSTRRTSSTKVAFVITFDKSMTRDEFIDLAEMTIYGRRIPGDWKGIPDQVKASLSPITVQVPESTLRSVFRNDIAKLPRHIRKFLTTGEGTVGSYQDIQSLAKAGTILATHDVTDEELQFLEMQQADAKSHGTEPSEASDPVAWAEAYVAQRQESAEKALANRRDIVAARTQLDNWSQDDKNGIKNVAEGILGEETMHYILRRHGLSYSSLIGAFEFELRSITDAFLTQAEVALFRIERTYLANKNVGVEKERLRQAIDKVLPSASRRDLAAAERDRRVDTATLYGLFPAGASRDPRVAAAEAELAAQDEELQRQSAAAGLPVLSWKGFDWDAVRGGNIEASRGALRQFVSHAATQLRSARKKVAELKTLYKADRMVGLAKAAVGITPGSVFDDIITFRASRDMPDDGFWSTLWEIVTIALMFVPGNIGIALRVGAGIINTTTAMDEYAEGMALNRADLSTQAPSGLGVFLAAGGTLIDAQQMAKGVVKVIDREAIAGARLESHASAFHDLPPTPAARTGAPPPSEPPVLTTAPPTPPAPSIEIRGVQTSDPAHSIMIRPASVSSSLTQQEVAVLRNTEARLVERRPKLAREWQQERQRAIWKGNDADRAAATGADQAEIERLEKAFDDQNKIANELEAQLTTLDEEVAHVRTRLELESPPSVQPPAFAAGVMTEREVAEAFALGPKNTITMANPDPTKANFIPDHIAGNPTRLKWGTPYHFKEIKDWADMSDTGNLSAMLDYVDNVGGSRLSIYYRSDTYMSGPLRIRIEALMKAGKVDLVPFVGK